MLKRALLTLFLLAFAGGAAAFDLVDSQGRSHRLAQYKGKWVLVNYWATWCPPCRMEIPDLAALHRDKRNNLVVLGIAMDYQDPREVLEFAKRKAIPYPIILGDDRVVDQVGPVRGLPTTYLYDPQGKLVAYNVGALTRDAVEEYIGARKKTPAR
ncbi:TlpA family protein disulfide reductase [Parasulfuritortus cantonensis]|uniref:TlpA family protein disulfide reductase n=1 Tax=Parasulfuritortus cantonensis TaxID=2528202 RepID=A0A4R1BE09_9PROT|nr:TlpA disulfide reductase family protein [Parasulfuritortus cantonensis]TCJ15329.1 TlpA family protein disulfide reductase [Parasulfuritortus cantonensis]